MPSESELLLAAITLSPAGMLPEPPRTKPKHGKPGKSLALHSKSAKAVALARVEYLPIQQCGRSLLAIYVQLARGQRARTWLKDETVAELLVRSGACTTYSVPHTRRWRRILEDLGLLRTTYVRKGEPLPLGTDPDLDEGLPSRWGQNVVEVNMDALLGLAPVWPRPMRGGGWQAAREAKAAASELRELVAKGLEACAELDADEPPAAPERASESGDRPAAGGAGNAAAPSGGGSWKITRE